MHAEDVLGLSASLIREQLSRTFTTTKTWLESPGNMVFDSYSFTSLCNLASDILTVACGYLEDFTPSLHEFKMDLNVMSFIITL